MRATFVTLFLLIAGTQAISNSAYDKNITSQGTGLIQSRGKKAQELLEYPTPSASQTSTGKFYGRMVGTRMLSADKVEGSIKHELYSTWRKAQGGGRAGAGGRARAVGSRGARGSRGSKGIYGYGGANVNHHKTTRFKSSAPSSLSLPWPSFWTSTLILSVSLDLILLFPLHY